MLKSEFVSLRTANATKVAFELNFGHTSANHRDKESIKVLKEVFSPIFI